MKLDIGAKELLALHNLLRDAVRGPGGSDDPDVAALRQLHARVRSAVVSFLAGRPSADPVKAFLSREQQKIDALRAQTTEIVLDGNELAREAMRARRQVDDVDDMPADYPRRSRKGTPGRQK